MVHGIPRIAEGPSRKKRAQDDNASAVFSSFALVLSPFCVGALTINALAYVEILPCHHASPAH
jgi:hypothetical protein